MKAKSDWSRYRGRRDEIVSLGIRGAGRGWMAGCLILYAFVALKIVIGVPDPVPLRFASQVADKIQYFQPLSSHPLSASAAQKAAYSAMYQKMEG